MPRVLLFPGLCLALGLVAAASCGDDDNDGCDCSAVACNAAACTRAVFVTNQAFPANFGGVAQADQACQAAAQAAGLEGTFSAWLSSSQTSPLDRFSESQVPYALRDGAVLADSWADLVAEGPAVPIDVDETGKKITDGSSPRAVWTNTGRDGRAEDYATASDYCADWTDNSGMHQAVLGWIVKRNETDDWTYAVVAPCTGSASFYCFQQ